MKRRKRKSIIRVRGRRYRLIGRKTTRKRARKRGRRKLL